MEEPKYVYDVEGRTQKLFEKMMAKGYDMMQWLGSARLTD